MLIQCTPLLVEKAGVTPEVHLRNLLCIGEGIHPGFETQGRSHQKSKTGVSVAPQKRTCVLQKFKKKILQQFYIIKKVLLKPRSWNILWWHISFLGPFVFSIVLQPQNVMNLLLCTLVDNPVQVDMNKWTMKFWECNQETVDWSLRIDQFYENKS